jgi:hypothetical protein
MEIMSLNGSLFVFLIQGDTPCSSSYPPICIIYLFSFRLLFDFITTSLLNMYTSGQTLSIWTSMFQCGMSDGEHLDVDHDPDM